jgi:hypothetical protein
MKRVAWEGKWPHLIALSGQGTGRRILRERIARKFDGIIIEDKYKDSAVVRGLTRYIATLEDAKLSARELLLNVCGRYIGIKYALQTSGRGAREVSNLFH